MIRRSRSRTGRLVERALRLVLTTALVMALVGPLPAIAGPAPEPTVITAAYGSFGPTTMGSYQLNGSAALDGGVVMLTPANEGQAGSMFWKHKVALSDQGSFSTAFSYRMSDPDIWAFGADGMTFCIQPGSNTAVTEGGGLGYQGIDDSLAIEFDTYDNGIDSGDPDGNHIGIDLNGSVNSAVTAPAPFELVSGATQFAWVDYDGTQDKLEVRIAETNTRPTDPTLEYTIDLENTYGSDIFIGFTAATGGSYARHEVGSWFFTNDFDPAGLTPATTNYVMGPAMITGVAEQDTLDSGASTKITFTAVDAEGNPASDTTLAISAPEGGSVASSAVTDENGEATVTFTVPSGGGKKLYSVRASVSTGVYGSVTLTTGNSKPVVNPNSGINHTFYGYDSYTSVAPTLTISDADDTSLTKAVVRIVDPGDSESISIWESGGRGIEPQGAPQGIDSSSDRTQITLTGRASIASYARMLRSVVFRGPLPPGATRTVEFTVWDDMSASEPKTSTMSLGSASQDASAAVHVNLDAAGNPQGDVYGTTRGSRTPAISADGRYVVFLTGNSYVEADDNNDRNWYRKDLQTGAIELVDVNFETGEAVSDTNLSDSDGRASLSYDGRFVAFESQSAEVAPADYNGEQYHNVFLRDMVSGETTLVSASMNTDEGVRSASNSSYWPSVSDDGRYVVFSSYGEDLVPDDLGDQEDVFLKDMQTGAVTRVSQNAEAVGGDDGSEQPEISGDGTHVAFRSWATNLGPANPQGDDQIFVCELATGEIELVSKNNDGMIVDCCSWQPTLSSDGRYVAFVSDSDVLNPQGDGESDSVFVHDRMTDTTQWVSHGWNGTGGPGGDDAWISDNGRFVAYRSWGWQKLPSHAADNGEIVVVDLWQGTTQIATVNGANEVADGNAWEPVLSGDGSRVAFTADADNLGDPDDNNYTKSVFSTELNPTPAEANMAPYARWDSASGAIDSPVTVSAPGVLANDTDHDGDTMTAYLAGEPLSGEVVVNSDGSFTYTPDDGFAGTDRFFYRAYDGESWSAPTAVDVSVLRVERSWIISTDSNWMQQRDSNGNWSASRSPGMNASGSFVGFLSHVCLSEEDTNSDLNWYLKNTQTGETRLVDKNLDGMASTGNGMWSGYGKISVSADGKRVVFDSNDDNLVLDDVKSSTDVFAKDMASGETTLVSQLPDMTMTNSTWPSIDDAGRYVTFVGTAQPLVGSEPSDSMELYQQVYVRDLASGETTLVSHNMEGMPSNGYANHPEISADGSKIAFMSYANDIVPGVDQTNSQIYVYDVASGAISHVSKSETGEPATWSDWPTLDADGSTVSFLVSDALVANDTNGSTDVYVRNLDTSSTACVSVDPSGIPVGGGERPVISDDGLSVAFVASSSSIVDGYSGDTVFVRDLALDRTFVASQGTAGGSPNGSSMYPAISANGMLVAYDSWATNIVTPDLNGGYRDVFLTKLTELDRDYTPAVARSGTGSSVYASVAYSKLAWKSAGTVVLARWDDGVDAFSAAGLAGSYGAPVLSTPKSFLSPAVKAEIKRLGAKKVFIIGGTKAVFPGVVTSLKKMGVSVERLGGDGRYATSVAVGKRIKKHDGAKFSDYVIVANGTSKSARSAAGLAYQLKAPVIYTYRGSYSAAAKSFIATGGFKKIIVVGPTSLVSTTVAKKLASAGKCSYTRAYGSDRYGTAVAVANQQLKYGPTRIAHVALVSGDTFAYAPWAGPAIARMGGVLCATAPTKLSSPTSKWLTGHAGEVVDIRLMGNGSSPSNAVGQAAALAATGPLVD